MLKIRDDVELKELEKFGFKISKKCSSEYYEKKLKNTNGVCFLTIMPISKELKIDADRAMYILEIEVIYDLVQAGLVEKVKE